MPPKSCLFVTALLLPACIDPATQGSTGSTSDATDSDPTGTSTGDTTGPVDPTESVMTSNSPTSTTAPVEPGCDDGVKNGDETDIDCGGGTCGACDGGAACSDDSDCKSGDCAGDTCAALAASCLELHTDQPDLPSGDYALDPDGDGVADGDYYCDMDPASPGWTRVYAPDSGDGTWDPLKEGACGDLGDMFGPYGTGEVLTLDATALGVPHAELRVSAELVVMDSWDAFDNEQIVIKLGGADIFAQVCDFQSSFTCNQDMQHCGGMDWSDGVLPITADPAAHDGDDVALSFTSTLNEPVDNESWGVRAVTVFVK